MAINDLLRNLANGAYDGARTDSEMNGVSWGFYIDKGTQVKYREGRGGKHFDGKENERFAGSRTEDRYETDAEKTAFLQRYGFNREMFCNHPEVMDYSRQYYESRKKE